MNITDDNTERFKMSEEETELRAMLVMAQHELKEYKSAFDNFKKTGRPITLPANLTPSEYNHMIDYIQKQDKRLNKELKRQARLKPKGSA